MELIIKLVKRMEIMDTIIKIEKKITKVLEFLMMIGFAATATLVFVVAFLRYTLGTSILWAPEIALLMFIWCSSIGSALMIVQRQHVKISYFADLTPKPVRRILEIIVFGFIIWINIVFIQYSLPWIESTGYYTSAFTGLEASVSQIAIPVGCSLVVLYSVYAILLLLFRPETYFTEAKDDISIS